MHRRINASGMLGVRPIVVQKERRRKRKRQRSPSVPCYTYHSLLVMLLLYIPSTAAMSSSEFVKDGPFRGEVISHKTSRQQPTQQAGFSNDSSASTCTLCIDGSPPSLPDKEITNPDIPLPTCGALADGLVFVGSLESYRCQAAQISQGLFCGCPIPNDNPCLLCPNNENNRVPLQYHDVLTGIPSASYIPGARQDGIMTCQALESYLLMKVTSSDEECNAILQHQVPQDDEDKLLAELCGCNNTGPTLALVQDVEEGPECGEASQNIMCPPIQCMAEPCPPNVCVDGRCVPLRPELISSSISTIQCQDELDRLQECLDSERCNSDSNCIVENFEPPRNPEFDTKSSPVAIVNDAANDVCQKITTEFCETVECCSGCFAQVTFYSECLTGIYNEAFAAGLELLSIDGTANQSQCNVGAFECEQHMNEGSDEAIYHFATHDEEYDYDETSDKWFCQQRQEILDTCWIVNSCNSTCTRVSAQQNFTREALEQLGSPLDVDNLEYETMLLNTTSQLACADSISHFCDSKTCCSECKEELESHIGCLHVTRNLQAEKEMQSNIDKNYNPATSGLRLRQPNLFQCKMQNGDQICDMDTMTENSLNISIGRPVLINSSFVIAIDERMTAAMLLPTNAEGAESLQLFILEESYKKLVQNLQDDVSSLGEDDGNTAGLKGNATAVLERYARGTRRRRLGEVSLDAESPELYDSRDVSCPDGDAVEGRQLFNSSNCILVFGMYRVYVEDDESIEQAYIDYAVASQAAIASGVLEEFLVPGDDRAMNFRVVNAYPTVIDESFDAFAELSSPIFSPTTAAPTAKEMNVTTMAPTVAETRVPTHAPETTNEDKSYATKYEYLLSTTILAILMGIIENC